MKINRSFRTKFTHSPYQKHKICVIPFRTLLWMRSEAKSMVCTMHFYGYKLVTPWQIWVIGITVRTKPKHEIEDEADKPEMKIEICNISSLRKCEKKNLSIYVISAYAFVFSLHMLWFYHIGTLLYAKKRKKKEPITTHSLNALSMNENKNELLLPIIHTDFNGKYVQIEWDCVCVCA